MPRVKVGPALPDIKTLNVEIARLRELDLTDTHPAIIFEPTAPYRLKDDP